MIRTENIIKSVAPTLNPAPKVSVSMITYNHGEFIAQAIESVLMQQTTFPYELVIGEDCSTDNTREIARAYQERYPAVIRLIIREANVGIKANVRETIGACRGEYIALLDGDNYWTSPDKLQKQVDILTAHPEWSCCSHDAMQLHDNEQTLQNYCSPDTPSLLPLEMILTYDCLPACSLLFRRNYLNLPEWFDTILTGDWALIVLSAQHGPISYIPEVLGVYRLHNSGIWSSLDTIKRTTCVIQARECFGQHLAHDIQI